MIQNTIELMKFRRARRELGIPGPLLVGHLEYVWRTAHIQINPRLLRAEIEEHAEWEGAPGALLAVLIKHGWLDEVDENTVEIHSYFEHCPKHVKGNWTKKHKTKPWEDNEKPPLKAPPQGKNPKGSSPRAKPQGLLPKGSTHIKQSKAEQSKAEQSKVEQSKAEKNAGARSDPPTEDPSERLRSAPLGISSLDSALDSLKSTMNTNAEDFFSELAQRCITNGVEPHASDWLTKCFSAISNAEGTLTSIEDACAKVENSNIPGNPKGVGPFKEPGKFLVSQILELARARGAKVPSFPNETKNTEMDFL